MNILGNTLSLFANMSYIAALGCVFYVNIMIPLQMRPTGAIDQKYKAQSNAVTSGNCEVVYFLVSCQHPPYLLSQLCLYFQIDVML